MRIGVGSFLLALLCFCSLFHDIHGDSTSFVNMTLYNPCPAGASMYQDYGFCFDGIKASGAFSQSINLYCATLLGLPCLTSTCLTDGVRSVSINNFLYLLIAPLMTPGSCMFGTSKNSTLRNLCYEDFNSGGLNYKYVYGPFPVALQQLCVEKGGHVTCLTNRWPADFFMFLMDLYDNKPVVHCDSNGDKIFDCIINWPYKPKGSCDCGSSVDQDGDGVLDCYDYCPQNPTKTYNGYCGCNQTDSDTDSDGLVDCFDGCPNDSSKTYPGICGCGVAEGKCATTTTATPTTTDTTTAITSATDTTSATTPVVSTPTPSPTSDVITSSTSVDSPTTMTFDTTIDFTTTDVPATSLPPIIATPTMTDYYSSVTPVVTKNVLPDPTPTSTPTPKGISVPIVVASVTTVAITVLVAVFAVVLMTVMKKRKREEVDTGEVSLSGILNMEKIKKHEYSESVRQILTLHGSDTLYKLDTNGLGLLHYAAIIGDVEAVEFILEYSRRYYKDNFMIDIRDFNNNTPLMYACSHGNCGVAKLLIEYGARANLVNSQKDSLLHLAVQFEHHQIIDMLFEIKAEIDIEATNFNGNTALMIAAVTGQTDCALSLIKNGANVNCVDETGTTPLMSSIRVGHKNLIEPLLHAQCSVTQKDKNGNQAMHWASLINNSYAVMKILQITEGLEIQYNEPNNKGETPLYLAVREGNSEIVELFLSIPKLKLLDADAKSLLQLSRQKNFAHVSQILERFLNGTLKPVKFGYNSNPKPDAMTPPTSTSRNSETTSSPNWSSDHQVSSPELLTSSPMDLKINYESPSSNSSLSPLMSVIDDRDVPLVQMVDNLLAQNGESVLFQLDSNGLGLIHTAVLLSDVRAVEYIVLKGHRHTNVINMKDRFGCTPLMNACTLTKESAVTIASFLLSNNADPEIQNDKGETALHVACKFGSPAITCLIAREANCLAKDQYGNTPLMVACLSNRVDVVKKLIVACSSIEDSDNMGFTPLIASIRLGYDSVACMLIEYGANLDAVDKNGNTVLHWAARTNNVFILKELFKRGRKVSSKNEVNNNKETPIFLATKEGNIEIVKILLDHGADFRIVDQCGNNCLSFQDKPELMSLFKKYSIKL